MNNSYGDDQWSHYQNNSRHRTDTQQRQEQGRDRQRAAYAARTASQSQATTPEINKASHNFAHMNLDGYGRPVAGPSNPINRTEDRHFVKGDARFHDSHRRGASDNSGYTREDTRPTSSASSKGSLFGGFSFSRSGTSSSHKHSFSEGTEQPRRSSIKDKVQDVYRRMSNSYNKATDNFSKAVDPYMNITRLNAHERQKWEAELRQEAQDAEEEKRRSGVSSYPVSYHSTTPSGTSHDTVGERGEYRTDLYQAPKPKKSKDLFTPGERAAVLVSKIVDPVKKRRDSDDSDLSFADIAPPAEMDACSRCGEVVTGFLVKGRCQGCHGLWLQEFWDATDSPVVSSEGYEPDDTNSDYSTRSSSSSPRAPREVNEEEYMKLTASYRIRRVRQTIYDDPGNPFSLEDCNPDDGTPNEVDKMAYGMNAITSILKRLSDAIVEPSPPHSPESFGPNPFEEQATDHGPDFIMLTLISPTATTPTTLTNAVYTPHLRSTRPAAQAPDPSSSSDSPISLGPNPFEERPCLNFSNVDNVSNASNVRNAVRDSSTLLAPAPRRSGTPALIRDLSIASPPPPEDERFQMILSGSVRRAARSHQRSETVTGGSERKVGIRSDMGIEQGERNTKFYGYWDDLLVEYGKGKKF
ncbi:hypothetical protein DOTSEDRAFT_38476 [Dothistroma septosporum NZE10]|uniref:Uncharacterized protein n=1 Tax=Dothistroma septosporum (strain NZE10 / CBS 128990) TaxID=675120 RepID=M2YK34_DOTSN|nr:hypothetical protein DOTSEDRAFT_38476 [Dothistroma septosporum NZE10]